jgi:hypothetical protein
MKLKFYAKIVVIAGLIAMFSIQYYIRPNYPDRDLLKVLMGCFPNFISGIIIPYAGYWLFSRQINYYSSITLAFIHIALCFMLLTYEALQAIPFFGKTFDVLDVTTTFIGVSVSYFSMRSLMSQAVIDINAMSQDEANEVDRVAA